MISIVCVLYVIFILRNLQKNGWEREKSWITFGHTYYETSAKPSFIEKIYLVVFRIILQRVYWYN